MRRAAVWLLLALTIGLGGGSARAQNIDMAAVAAADDFRWGVQAYNNGLFDKSILSFEKSLSEKPNDARTMDWLGRAYYRSGFVENALDMWKNVVSLGQGTALLQNRIQTIAFRRGLGKELTADQTRYVVAKSIPGVLPASTLFTRPSSVTPRPDGGFYVASFATNDVLQLDANGVLVRKVRPGFVGFDHPFDVLDPGNGYLYVSEYGANRITRCTPDGGGVLRFGATGVGPGQLLGPQFLASDDKGYLYVTDVGNARVEKFDDAGKFILQFGQPSDPFPGLAQPSGIVVYGEKVFVADSANKDIAVFDTSGNYITTLLDGRLSAPEGLSLFDQSGDLVISDGTRILLYNVDNDVLTQLADLRGTAQQLMKSTLDANGDLLSADFTANTIFVLSQYADMYSGLSVQIDRVYSDKFPSVTVDLTVKTRLGEPFTGLDSRNFAITEGGAPVADSRLVFKGMNGEPQIALLIDRSSSMAAHQSDITNAVGSIIGALRSGGQFRVVSAGASPVVEAGPNTPPGTAARAAAENGSYSDAWRFDLGLRAAASQLLPKQGKSAVVFVTQGDLGPNAFKQFALEDLLHYLQNNGIRFYCVFVDQGARISQALQYLVRETGGASYYLYQPQGIAGIVDRVRAQRDGSYVFTYRSMSPPNFGNSFIPVEVEAHLFARSGRDESGYFAPLQY